MIEALETRQLLAGDLPFDEGPNNIGEINAQIVIEQESLGEIGVNDRFTNAQALRLGTGDGDRQAIDVVGNLSIQSSTTGAPNQITDIDTYRVSLRAGDILDIAVQDAATQITVFYGEINPSAIGTPAARAELQAGQLWFATDTNQGAFDGGGPIDYNYPTGSPLQIAGNAVAAQVVPSTRDYFIQISGGTSEGAYTMGLRAYRPGPERLPVGEVQKIFLDFNGGTINSTEFFGLPPGTNVRVDSFAQTLSDLDPTFQTTTGGISPAVQDVLDRVVQESKRIFDQLGQDTINENYGFEIVTSNPVNIADGTPIESDPFGEDDPNSLHVLVGGTAFAPPTIGQSQTLDIGNFRLNEKVYATLDLLFDVAELVPLSTRVSRIDAFVALTAFTIVHEVGHAIGMRHTDPDNNINNVADPIIGPGGIGLGPDNIFGTDDDVALRFFNERFRPLEGFIGFEQLVDGLGFALTSGNNGVPTGGGGTPGGGGTGNPGTGGGGTGGGGTGGGGTGGGGTPVNTPVTIGGTVFADSSDDQTFDAGELALPNVYVYLDLDNDNNPDLGEPAATTNATGQYSLTLTTPGTYNVRIVDVPGFTVTLPTDQEQTVVYNGTTATGTEAQNGRYNFGLLPTQDYADGPARYNTASTSHGLIDGLTLGALVDRDVAAPISADATGDDNTGVDDEDGVTILTPISPGNAAAFSVATTNTTGEPAFLQAFFDFNDDGDYTDAGERVLSDSPVAAGTSTTSLTVDLPSSTSLGPINARFRISPIAGIGSTGFANGGEVEDYQFNVSATAEIAADDVFDVSRNTVNTPLDVLANDFQTASNALRITAFNNDGIAGSVRISNDGRSLLYTPPLSFVGTETFTYTVTDAAGNNSTANVSVNVRFQVDDPIAVDDVFVIPDNSTERPLNVLQNDLAGRTGSLTIANVSPGDNGGTINIALDGQTLIYTPQFGTNGFEQFTYTVRDGDGMTSTATVTVTNLVASTIDDQVQYEINLLDPINNTPITSIAAGEEFLLEVRVQDIADLTGDGVASAFLDVLYTAGLVSVTGAEDGNVENPQITFGQFFDGDVTGNGTPGLDPSFQSFDVSVPGIVNEVGGVQDLQNIVRQTPDDLPNDGRTEVDDYRLFTLRMTAETPGVAVFSADPADAIPSETILIDVDAVVPPSAQRLGRAELVILGQDGEFSSAVDDAFVASQIGGGTVTPSPISIGPVLDSNGNAINSNTTAVLDVLANDNLSTGATIREFGLNTTSSLADISIDNNDTPADFSDDVILYRRLPGRDGLDTFSYFIVTDTGVFSSAEVTVGLNIQNPQVAYDLVLVDQNGTPLTSVATGQTFGVQVYAEDLRGNQSPQTTGVFAAYQDVLYSANLAVSRNLTDVENASDSPAAFDVRYTDPFNQQGNFNADGTPVDPDEIVDGSLLSGTAIRTGIIDEFGSFNGDNAMLDQRQLVATLFFTATAPGTAVITGSPADNFPQQETLVRNNNDPVPVSAILYDSLRFNITPSGTSSVIAQNPTTIQDVNNDGNVTPLDALMVVNELRRMSFAIEGETVADTTGQPVRYIDVNGDSKITPLDALMVINYLRAEQFAPQIESEPVTAATGTIAVDPLTVATNVTQQSDQTIADFAAAASATPRPGLVLTDPQDDEEEDLFTLLAKDQLN